MAAVKRHRLSLSLSLSLLGGEVAGATLQIPAALKRPAAAAAAASAADGVVL